MYIAYEHDRLQEATSSLLCPMNPSWIYKGGG